MASLITAERTVAIIPNFVSFIKANNLKGFVSLYGSILDNKTVEDESIPALVRKYNLLKRADGIYVQGATEKKMTGGGCCPECGAPLMMAEGCATCSSMCGYSKCS